MFGSFLPPSPPPRSFFFFFLELGIKPRPTTWPHCQPLPREPLIPSAYGSRGFEPTHNICIKMMTCNFRNVTEYIIYVFLKESGHKCSGKRLSLPRSVWKEIHKEKIPVCIKGLEGLGVLLSGRGLT
jgi:hypothetical protein